LLIDAAKIFKKSSMEISEDFFVCVNADVLAIPAAAAVISSAIGLLLYTKILIA
jgi:hypothetical protein